MEAEEYRGKSITSRIGEAPASFGFGLPTKKRRFLVPRMKPTG